MPIFAADYGTTTGLRHPFPPALRQAVSVRTLIRDGH